MGLKKIVIDFLKILGTPYVQFGGDQRAASE